MSEFGKGFLYPLALFLAHADGLRSFVDRHSRAGMDENEGASLWIYGAADHLFDFDPNLAPQDLRGECERIRQFAISKRLPMGETRTITKEEAHTLIEDTKKVFLELDLANGVDAEKADFT